MIKIISGNLLDAREKYIAHQCNCLSKKSAGIAKFIFDKYPYSNTYFNRVEPDITGAIKILGNGLDKRYVINMFAQYYPGQPEYTSNLDSVKAREKYFHQCLLKISKINNLESIAFPYGIGCGLAQGNWDYYLGTIENFAKHIYDTKKAITTIYRFENL